MPVIRSFPCQAMKARLEGASGERSKNAGKERGGKNAGKQLRQSKHTDVTRLEGVIDLLSRDRSGSYLLDVVLAWGRHFGWLYSVYGYGYGYISKIAGNSL